MGVTAGGCADAAAVVQPDVFDMVAADAVLAALDGYNSTVFAYGQTGSGKTFTITGGAERYNDRGLIPRALSMIFSETSKRTDRQHQIYISYLELYNEVGYDLLDQVRTAPHHCTVVPPGWCDSLCN